MRHASKPTKVPKPYDLHQPASKENQEPHISTAHVPQNNAPGHHLVPYGPSRFRGHPKRFQVLNHDVRVEVRRRRHGTRGSRHDEATTRALPSPELPAQTQEEKSRAESAATAAAARAARQTSAVKGEEEDQLETQNQN